MKKENVTPAYNITPREKKLLKKARIKELMETYPGLLTDKEKKILSLYIDPDMSGALVARRLNVSRQAVHDHIKRATAKMEQCDKRANLVELRKKKIGVIVKIERAIDDLEAIAGKEGLPIIQEIKGLLKKLKRII